MGKRPKHPREMRPNKRRNQDDMATIGCNGSELSEPDNTVENTLPDIYCTDLYIGREESYDFHEHIEVVPAYCIESTLVASAAELNEKGFLRFTVKIDNVADFACRPRKAVSEQFYCRGFPFHLNVHNRGRGLTLSAYVCRDETENKLHDSGLEIVAVCELSIFDQIHETYKFKKVFSNSFRAGADWGYSHFLDRHQANIGGEGILLNNSLIINVQMKAEPPHCCGNSSKEITGFVGIRNQGATCYMNSLLQVLYFLNKFRTACYRIPTEMDDNSSMALALQKVFYNLEFSDSSVCTKNLTKSFGWSNVDVLMQHDVQEMMRVLIDRIESRMKNTLLEPILPSIFQGKFISYVKCRDIEFSSQREEVFYDVQLSLDKSTNVYDSFKRYVSPEMMDDDNKYHAGTHGLQAAEKGTLFMSLPPVMFLHLLRFQFDGTTNQVMKNNSYFEFYEHINLTEYVREEEATDWKYTLFAVLSHSGGGSHGHYVAYINPSLKGEWFKFDDDTISLVSTFDAIDSNYGSTNDVDEWTKSMQLNAYMLVYVRDRMADDVFEPTEQRYISEELKNASLTDGDVTNCYNLNNYTYTTEVFVLLTTLLESDITFLLKKFVAIPRFTVSRNITTNDFKKALVSAYRLSGMDQIRIWRVVCAASNNPFPVYLNEEESFIQATEWRDISRSSAVPPTVWAEIALPGEVLPPFDVNRDVLVFYSYYCAKECRHMYIHHGYHDRDASLAELVPLFNRLMEWTDRELNIYQVIRNTKVKELNTSSNFMDHAILQYDTLLMQIVFEPKEHDVSTKLNSIHLYYQDILCRVEFVASNADNTQKEDEIFVMSLESSFPELLDVLARRLNYDMKKIQIFRNRCITSGMPVPSSSTGTLRSLFECHYKRIQLFYRLHTVDVIDVETKHNFTFQWLSIDMKKQSSLTLYLSDDETIESILAAAEKIIDSVQTKGSGKFRILKVSEDRLSFVEDVAEIYTYFEEMKEQRLPQKAFFFRIEEIPKDDEILHENEKFIPVFQNRAHMQSRPTTHPFMLKVDMTESWQSVKDRLRSRLKISEKNWTDYTASVSSPNDWDDLEIDDTKCFNDVVQQSPETISICLNKMKNTFKPRRASTKFEMVKPTC
ncbi:ubiquitin carboxyl-terminal hydrolase 7-like isoform X2 [Bradysia coprophila]|uniref:ubiquitin carboxyl-terminal hydrolase 7-like isoform X2 n=1 Tax=Bradysia coprophila TaxID=38358 RepID=UPI00187DCF62|nr:ubiquitin carboxyl-terminal hydrolase 7-like isoform X2 [Bradysia coprophila]